MNIDDNDTLGNADLRRGQADAVRGVHGFQHVVHQLGDAGIHGFNRLGHEFQHRIGAMTMGRSAMVVSIPFPKVSGSFSDSCLRGKRQAWQGFRA